MQVFAVVGGIAAGKSTVCKLLAAHTGASVVDADRIGHRALESRLVRPQLLAWFGPDIVGVGGRIDRRRLGARVFGRPALLRRLNALVHPEIGRRIRDRLRRLKKRGVSLVFLDAALFLDANLGVEVDGVLVVTAPRASRRQRLAARDGLTRRQIESRLDSQPRIGAWTRAADVVVENPGSIDELAVGVKRAWSELQQVAARRSHQKG